MVYVFSWYTINREEKTMSERINLQRLFWDYQLSEQELQDCLDKNDPTDPLTISLYNRILLNTPSWYSILRMLSPDQLKTALSPRVINTIHSKAIQERYRFASSRLFPGTRHG